MRWAPDVPLTLLYDQRRQLAEPIVTYLRARTESHVFVLIAEVEPRRFWQRILQNQRGAVLARALRRHTDTVVCRLRFRVDPSRDLVPAATGSERIIRRTGV